MRTDEPLQGLIMAGGHYLIHFALLIAEPICWSYFSESYCDELDVTVTHRNLFDFRDLASSGAGNETVPSSHILTLNPNDRFYSMGVHLYCLLS